MINAQTIEEEKLGMIYGGVVSTASSKDTKEQNMRIECPSCHEIFQANVMKPFVKCPTCHYKITING